MQSIRVERQIGGRTLSIETGTFAKLSDGSVTVQYGETVVFAAVVRANPRENIDFFPLQVDYRERRAAAGKFPGGFLKREGRPTTKEILTARLIDRPLRPLFPKGFIDEVQIHLNVLAFDGENDPDVFAGVAASSALAISDIPFITATAHARVGRVNGELILFPTVEQLEYSDFDLVVAGTKNAVNMIEIGSRELTEDDAADAIEFGHKAVVEIVAAIEELVSKAGRPKIGEGKQADPALVEQIKSKITAKIKEVKGLAGKSDRSEATKKILGDLIGEIAPPPTAVDPNASYTAIMAHKEKIKQIRTVFGEVEEHATREAILSGVRPDGRGYNDIRPISCSVGVLPRVHGSAVFTRGETQSMCTVTLGTSGDEQMVDGLIQEYSQKFMLHYNFPSYSVGEVRPIRGPGRREIGHGALAERSLIAVLPGVDVFPYTVQVISDILESNGSSSMASSCGGCLALMDAGVPITKLVAGISVGLVKEGDRTELLTDIIGEEDHFGDMDFKVCGTRDGITAIQLDIKIEGIDYKIIRDTLHRAKEARFKILDIMEKTLPGPRKEISKWAPRLLTVKIDPEKIGKLIGPGGKNIKALQADTGANVDIEDDGTVYISSTDSAGAERCRDIIEAMTAEVKVGKIYQGRVVSIKDFGAFVEIAPDTDGLCHVSELSDKYVDRVENIVQMGQEIKVKVLLIDDQGRIKLSRKAALIEAGESDPDPVGAPAGGGGGGGGGFRDDRGPRRDDRGPRGGGGGGGGRGPRRD
jgi:polyribonucleotide nucleotidyltransferase